MTNTPRIWSATVVIACGVILSPFATPIMKLLNYRSAGENKDVINSALWVLGMLFCVIAFPFIPLSVSPNAQMVYAQFLALLLVVVWFFLYGRWFSTRIGSVVLKDIVYRSPFSAIFISLGVMAVSFYFIGFAVRFLKHI
jgi:hypothetical protein